MPALRHLLALLLALGVAASATGDGRSKHQKSPKHPASLALPALHAEPDLAGGRIVDAKGREVLLRGVNVNALVEYWQYGPIPPAIPFDPADARILNGIGWNAVRLLVSWSRVEPLPGVYDEAYLDQVAELVRLLARQNLYSILDFHQDAWSATLAARPDEVCPPRQTPAFGWDGAPGWATQDGGAPRCFGSMRELSPAVSAAFEAFWADAPGPGDVGIRTRYAKMVAHVARRFAKVRSVAGYDVMNEPNAFSNRARRTLDDLYAEVLAEVRAAEAAAGGFPHLIFFEPSVVWSQVAIGVPDDFPHDASIVFSPHIYRGGLSAGPIERFDFERARDDAAGFGGTPVFVGEWGSDPDRALDPTDVYFREHQALQDEFRFSATLWTWRESCGDPHKAGEALSGVPHVWGEWDLDCATQTVRGRRQALFDQLTRAYVRAAPGRLDETSYDPETGAFSAAGSGAPAGAELVAYYPARLHGRPELVGAGLRGLRFRPAQEGGAYIVARTSGGAWSLRATPLVRARGRW
jgi:endoglycosylceramidase